MDHGVPWWAAANGAGLTTLSVFLLNQGIRLIYGRVRHPQTQGKVERFHRTLGERLRWWGVPTNLRGFMRAFRRFREEYNERRPHEALAQAPPASRFVASGRTYVAQPPPWRYPADSDVRQLDANGMLQWRGRRLFVSAALAHQDVGCVGIGQRLVVAYRHMYVRELHLRTGQSVPLLKPVS